MTGDVRPLVGPKVSVIIPSRDRRSCVEALLADIGGQTLLPHEVIVVDQSPQPYGTLEGARVVRDEGRGPCRARNAGARVASGDILVFLDDDARVEPAFTEVLCEPIVTGRAVASTGSMCDEEGRYPDAPTGWESATDSWIVALTANPRRPGDGVTLSFSTACCAVDASVFEEIGGFDTFFDPNGAGEDREMGLRLFSAGHHIAYRGDARLHHAAHPVGGRRDSGHARLNVLQANLYYAVAKHFGPGVTAEYRAWWRREVWRRSRGAGFRRVPRVVRDLRAIDGHRREVEVALGQRSVAHGV